MTVEVAYALPTRQIVIALAVPTDATLAQALALSNILIRCPEIDLAINKVGIFGKLADVTTRLRPGDRIEIYRPLPADPKTARRRRVAAKRRQDLGVKSPSTRLNISPSK